MTALAVQVLLWIVVGAGAIGLASWMAHRSYSQFRRNARGPASKSLDRGGEWTKLGGHAARFLFATVSRPSRTAALVTATR